MNDVEAILANLREQIEAQIDYRYRAADLARQWFVAGKIVRSNVGGRAPA